MVSRVLLTCLGVVAAIAGCVQTQTYKFNDRPSIQTLPYNPNNQPKVIREPYYPPVTASPRAYRARRDVGGKISSNPSGGADAVLQAQSAFGSKDHNLVGTVFAAGNTGKGPVATGGSLGYNVNGHGIGISETHVPGVADITSQNARVSLFDNGAHKFDANAFKADTRLANGFEFTRTGASLDYSNINGHGGKLGMSSITNLGTTYEAAAKANLWQSTDRRTSLDLMGTASKTHGGPFDGQKNFGANLGLTHMFG